MISNKKPAGHSIYAIYVVSSFADSFVFAESLFSK